jgi:UDPglucose--hexose-1-phosphate uridylyltransferase
MSEFRTNLFTGQSVIIARDRSKRPMKLEKPNYEIETNEHEDDCPFCIGNENQTTQETFRIEEDKKWLVRSFYNMFPIITQDSESSKKEDFFINLDGCGVHEVLVDTYKHNGNFFNMSAYEFELMFTMYKDRYNELIDDENVKYISLFKNFLRNSGASMAHPHSQIISLPIIPKAVLEEVNNCRNYFEENNKSLHQSVIDFEIKEDKRVIHESENFIVIAPYASIYSGEISIINKSNEKFENISSDNIKEMSLIFKNLFNKMNNVYGVIPFNIFLHSHPKYDNCEDYYNWHIHIVPRKYNLGGFEIATGVFVNSTNPEELAKLLNY